MAIWYFRSRLPRTKTYSRILHCLLPSLITSFNREILRHPVICDLIFCIAATSADVDRYLIEIFRIIQGLISIHSIWDVEYKRQGAIVNYRPTANQTLAVKGDLLNAWLGPVIVGILRYNLSQFGLFYFGLLGDHLAVKKLFLYNNIILHVLPRYGCKMP